MVRIIDAINPITWNQTAHQIIENNFDVLIIRYWHPFFIPCYNRICKKINSSSPKTKIYAICDNIIPHETYFSQNFLIKRFLDKLDGVVIMSENVKNELLSLKPKINYRQLFLPILDDLSPVLNTKESREKIGLDNDKVVVLFFGLIRNYKGLDILIKSLGHLSENSLKRIQLLIVGECYENINKYNKIIKQYNLSKYIKWINEYVADDQVNLYFSAANYKL